MPDPMLIARGTNDVCLLRHMANRRALPMAEAAAESTARAAASQLHLSVTPAIPGSRFGRKR